jgi:hypothetical protein
MLNGIIRSIFEGYKAAKSERKTVFDSWEYDQLLDTPYLHSSQFLNQLYEDAQNDKDAGSYKIDCIVEHMNRHGVWDIDGYKKVEQKIIDKRW